MRPLGVENSNDGRAQAQNRLIQIGKEGTNQLSCFDLNQIPAISMQRIRSSLDNRPYSTLITLSILIRIITLVYLYLAKFIIPTFDPQAQPFFPFHLRHYETFARWDTLHFIRIAKAGYTIDQELAFMPGLPFCMRILGKLIQAGRQRQGELLVTMEVLGGGIISAGIAGTLAILVLYK